ncbi:MAG: putative transport system ATP-binding protein [Kosmotogales bacterium]|nr:putative transport system ATP-binding protein [Kosmotogales bacterium]
MRIVMHLEEIWKTYDMGEVKVDALKGVTFSVGEGEIVIIIGPSGSGKSTLLHILGCLDNSTKGRLDIDGIDVSKYKSKKLSKIRNSKIGFVFQRYNLLPKLSAFENVELPMIYSHMNRSERRKKALGLLELVGLGDRVNHKPSQLSGGQQQRVAIARALSNDPAFILADEPTGNLDTKSGEEIENLFLKLNKMGKTIVIVTHDMEMMPLGSKVVRIRDGEIESTEVKEIGSNN